MSDEKVDKVRQRMQTLRGDLRHDMHEVAADMRSVSDWKYYVRRFPWGSIATAAIAGYLVVPRRPEIVSPDAETLAALAKRDQLVVKRRPHAGKSRSLIGTAATMAATGLARAAIAYVGQQFGSTATTTQHSTEARKPAPR